MTFVSRSEIAVLHEEIAVARDLVLASVESDGGPAR
jgi:hypothetical protein